MTQTITRSKRLLRALLGRDLLQGAQMVCPTAHHGSAYGGWTVCPLGLTVDSIVYSFGVGTDITFDQSLIETYGLRVYGFDPTPRSLAWVKAQSLPERFTFIEYGLADFDGTATFNAPAHPDHVSFTLRQDSEAASAEGAEGQVRRLGTIASELGHDRIDILKMDIEGAEYAALEDLARANLRIDQILVEFHHRMPGYSPRQTRDAIALLNGLGYRIFHVSPSGNEYSFIQADAHPHRS